MSCEETLGLVSYTCREPPDIVFAAADAVAHLYQAKNNVTRQFSLTVQREDLQYGLGSSIESGFLSSGSNCPVCPIADRS